MRNFIQIVEGQSTPAEIVCREGEAYALQNGCELSLEPMVAAGGPHPTCIALQWIKRLPEAPRGSGADVLRHLCGLADDHDVRIDLLVDKGAEKLVSLYHMMDFRISRWEGQEPYMVRDPESERSEFDEDEPEAWGDDGPDEDDED